MPHLSGLARTERPISAAAAAEAAKAAISNKALPFVMLTVVVIGRTRQERERKSRSWVAKLRIAHINLTRFLLSCTAGAINYSSYKSESCVIVSVEKKFPPPLSCCEELFSAVSRFPVRFSPWERCMMLLMLFPPLASQQNLTLFEQDSHRCARVGSKRHSAFNEKSLDR